jgi:hypothetical protein
VAVAAIDLAGREMARRSLIHAVLGVRPSVGALVALAVIAATVAIVASKGRRSAGLVLGALFTVGLALQLQLGARLQSDGFYYFAYLRSMAFDRDVDFTNDYRMLGLGDKTYLFEPTKTGYAQCAWAIGTAIGWSPFFAAGHVVATRLHAQGLDVSTDGTSYPYRQAACVASLFYGLLGCWFAYRLARLFFPAQLAGPAVAFTIAGSFMAWYLVKEPSMTHATAMASVAGFTWMWAATRERRTLRSWALLGVLAGVMALVRWQNLLFALLPALDAVQILARSRRTGDAREFRGVLAGGAVFLVCAVVAFVPQMLAWQAIYGSPIARSPIGPQIRWTDPHLVDILWSARNGLFSTAPILYLGAIGLLGFAFARPAVGVPMVAAAAAMVYFNARIQDWWGSAGFGGRLFDGVIPIFAIGLAASPPLRGRLIRRHAVAAVMALLRADGRLEWRADGGRADGRDPYRRNALLRSRVGIAIAGGARLVRQPVQLSGQPGVRAAQRRLARRLRSVVDRSLHRRSAAALRTRGRGEHRSRGGGRLVDRRRLARAGEGRRGDLPLGRIARDAADPARPRGATSAAGASPRVRVSGSAAADAHDLGQRLGKPARHVPAFARDAGLADGRMHAG